MHKRAGEKRIKLLETVIQFHPREPSPAVGLSLPVCIDSSMEYLEFDFFLIWHLITLCPKNLFKNVIRIHPLEAQKSLRSRWANLFFLAFVDLFLCVRQILFLSLFLIARISTRDQRTS